jgi:nucleotide-binding universal stress UspA family protein
MEDAMTSSTKGEIAEKSVILVAVDLSPVSESVMETAVRVVGSRAAELHLLHVLRPEPPELVATPFFATVLEQTKKQLDELTRDLPSSVERVVIHVRAGDPAVQIAQVASDIASDLVVVGTHGHKGLDRLLLGSVAEALVRNAPCPVLTYRPKSVRLWERIEPPCEDCIAVRRETARATLWCERHSQHHPRAHTYHEAPESFGVGSQTFR